jgi:uncharacterized protein (UPF0332 family)
MSLSEDLLEQASALCELDSRRPKQANLRRAVSAAYYAVFHAVVQAAVRAMIPARSELRSLVSRKFSHSTIKSAAQRTAEAIRRTQSQTNSALSPAEYHVLRLTNAFVDLQEARHKADYDVTEVFTELQVSKWLDDAKLAAQSLESVRATERGEQVFWEMLLGKLDR